jgi:hypothetical protein
MFPDDDRAGRSRIARNRAGPGLRGGRGNRHALQDADDRLSGPHAFTDARGDPKVRARGDHDVDLRTQPDYAETLTEGHLFAFAQVQGDLADEP